ncbi:MAG: NADH-quinone oxidoreductase subunit H [Armatimonadetes bacterium]|nr:NADH-quinone oxidoreductase subunit H [Armatimonadota bacterium]
MLILVPGLIWWERRLLSWMQDRVGPNRTGTITVPDRFPFLKGRKFRTFGLLQPICDGVKLFLKEDITPASIDRKIYFLAPAVALFPAFAIGGTLPWGSVTLPFADAIGGVYSYLTPVANVDIGILYVLAISSLGVYGVVLAGYSSNNKYSLMGGLRSSAQLISYELAMGMSLACVALATGSLRMADMVREQEKALWGVAPGLQNWFLFTPFGFVSAVVFLICMIAETNRAPFDLPEAENELIAGYHTEYSSMKFAVFFMGEYAAMFMLSGVFAAVFLGGYNLLPVNWEALAVSPPSWLAGGAAFFKSMAWFNYWAGPLVFIGKCAGGITFFIWLRATLPRLRYDQLMNLGWKTMLPLGVANFLVVALWIIATRLWGTGGGWVAWAAAAGVLLVGYLNIAALARKSDLAFGARKVKLADPAPTRSVRLVDPKKA